MGHSYKAKYHGYGSQSEFHVGGGGGGPLAEYQVLLAAGTATAMSYSYHGCLQHLNSLVHTSTGSQICILQAGSRKPQLPLSLSGIYQLRLRVPRRPDGRYTTVSLVAPPSWCQGRFTFMQSVICFVQQQFQFQHTVI